MRNTRVIRVNIPVTLAKKLGKILGKKNYSALVTEALNQYMLKKEKIFRLRKSMSEAAMKAGVFTEEDVVKAVHDTRKWYKKRRKCI